MPISSIYGDRAEIMKSTSILNHIQMQSQFSVT